MPVPQHRNVKKHRRSGRAYKPYQGVPLLRGYEQGRPAIEEALDETAGLTFEERLDLIPRPCDWLEEQAQRDTLEERLLHVRQGGFLDRREEEESDYDRDIGSDFDDLIEMDDIG